MVLRMVEAICVFVKYSAATEIYTYGHSLSLHDALPISFAAGIASDNGIGPRGTTGKIAIGGACLGRGYRDDDLKTDAAFRTVRSPSSRTSYSVYLTGDLGRMDEAGTLCFHGRLDDQL